MMNTISKVTFGILLLSLIAQTAFAHSGQQTERPNILIAISDDHSWKHTSVEGSPFVDTPNLDSVANAGFRFSNAYSASPEIC